MAANSVMLFQDKYQHFHCWKRASILTFAHGSSLGHQGGRVDSLPQPGLPRPTKEIQSFFSSVYWRVSRVVQNDDCYKKQALSTHFTGVNSHKNDFYRLLSSAIPMLEE
ncbi:hypothetical protein J437_LFUL000812 [Ladona fulva]|uniref:Uncharacterized protein n=1 Tax=Ladona fulva TaxID=123851 RepID=A0A8K0PBM5_LADFU|nr:hypothetical protein J437_LFUL000812 [Ladona fulva]